MGSIQLSVLIPVYNEIKTLPIIIQKVQEVPLSKEIIIVDDGSTDGTKELLDLYKDKDGIKVIFNSQNLGKGASLRRAIQEARGKTVIFQDADLEYDPGEYPLLVEPILNGEAEVVYGSRYSGEKRKVETFMHVAGNWFLTMLSNVMSGIYLRDMETCYKAFHRELLQNIILVADRFGIEPEITAKLAKIPDLNFWEIPISYRSRWYDDGKKIGVRDGFSAIYSIIRFNLFTSVSQSFTRDPSGILEGIRSAVDS